MEHGSGAACPHGNGRKISLTVLLSGIKAGDVLGFAAAVVFSLLPLLIFTFFEEEIMDGLGEYKLK